MPDKPVRDDKIERHRRRRRRQAIIVIAACQLSTIDKNAAVVPIKSACCRACASQTDAAPVHVRPHLAARSGHDHRTAHRGRHRQRPPGTGRAPQRAASGPRLRHEPRARQGGRAAARESGPGAGEPAARILRAHAHGHRPQGHLRTAHRPRDLRLRDRAVAHHVGGNRQVEAPGRRDVRAGRQRLRREAGAGGFRLPPHAVRHERERPHPARLRRDRQRDAGGHRPHRQALRRSPQDRRDASADRRSHRGARQGPPEGRARLSHRHGEDGGRRAVRGPAGSAGRLGDHGFGSFTVCDR